MEGNDTFSEGDGTVSCCVEISGLPIGGLGCDIDVMLQEMIPSLPSSAGVCIVHIGLKIIPKWCNCLMCRKR